MKVFSSKDDRRRGLVAVVLGVASLFALFIAARQYAAFVFDAEALRAWIGQFGFFSPLIFIFLQAIQVVVAPIPGQVVALVAGYLFGSVAGTAYSLTGVLIGSVIAFSLSKWYGRPLVESVLHEDLLTRFDDFVNQVGFPGLIAFVLIPGLPDDVICFLAGLTTWRHRTFIAAISIGRLPAYVLTVYAGGELADGQVVNGLLLVGVVIAVSTIGYYNQELIRDLVQRLEVRLR